MMDERLYDIDDAMQFLRVSRSTIYNLMRSGRLVGSQLGSAWRFRKADLDAALIRRDLAYPGRPTREMATKKSGLPPFMKFG